MTTIFASNPSGHTSVERKAWALWPRESEAWRAATGHLDPGQPLVESQVWSMGTRGGGSSEGFSEDRVRGPREALCRAMHSGG